jgi:hypothetical protein
MKQVVQIVQRDKWWVEVQIVQRDKWW